MRNTGFYPLCARGDINLYAVFAERMRELSSRLVVLGAVPSGIATDDTTNVFFQEVVNSSHLSASLSSRTKDSFPALQQGHMFASVFTVAEARAMSAMRADFVFSSPTNLRAATTDRRFTLSPMKSLSSIRTRGRAPSFGTQHDAELTKAILSDVPV